MTVLEVIQRSTEFLTRKGVDSPRLHAELLLAHQLKQPRMRLYLDFQRVLDAADLEAMRELVQRRGKREPLQQITGSTSFCGFEIQVTPEVLVPRPETELLAECGWEFLSGLAGRLPRPPEVLEFGVGSGCLVITLAQKCPTARLWGVELSPAALEVARRNVSFHRLEDRLQILLGDGFAAVPAEARFDLIVSNPPYIPSAEIADLQPEVRDFEPRLALDGGADGLDYYRRLAAEAGAWLRPEARLMVEFGDGQDRALRGLFEAEKWVVEAVREDYTHRARILVARRA